MKYWKIFLLIFFCVLFGGIAIDDVYSLEQDEDIPIGSSQLEYQIFLPLIEWPDQFDNHTVPIWVHNTSPQTHEASIEIMQAEVIPGHPAAGRGPAAERGYVARTAAISPYTPQLHRQPRKSGPADPQKL